MAKDPDYASSIGTPEYEKYIAAQKRIEEILTKRENQLFDPTLLAMAQGFLAPTKTGSFGESLGNVAGAVAPVQANEEKRAMEMAKIRSEMAQQELGMSMQIRQQQKMQSHLDSNMAEPPPTAPSAMPPQALPKPMQGDMQAGPPITPTPIANAPSEAPVTAPVAYPVKEQAPPSAPMPSGGPAPAPAPMVARAPAPVSAPAPALAPKNKNNSFNYTGAERSMIELGLSQGKTYPDMVKLIDEMRNNETVFKENYFYNKKSGEVTPINSGEQTDVQLHGEPSPRRVFKSDAIKLSNAASSENWDEYRKIADRIKYGPTPPPPSGGAGAPAPAPRVAAPTIAEAEATKAGLIAEKTGEGTGRSKRTNEALDKYTSAEGAKNLAMGVKELVNQEGGNLIVGAFAKPTVQAAILGMVAKEQFNPDSLNDAYVKLKVKYDVPRNQGESKQDYEDRKQAIIDRSQVAFSQMAQLQFQASMLAKGQGQISDGERRMFSDTTISKNDSVGAINKKADMLIVHSKFAKMVADDLTKMNLSFDKYKQTPEYKKIEKDLESDLMKVLNPGRAKTGSGYNAPAGHDDHKAQRDALRKELEM